MAGPRDVVSARLRVLHPGGGPELVLRPPPAPGRAPSAAPRPGGGDPPDPHRAARHLWRPDGCMRSSTVRASRAIARPSTRSCTGRGGSPPCASAGSGLAGGTRGRGQVPKPNGRWASDITGLKTWDGRKRRLAVILDCADRSVLAWQLAARITAEDLAELVREAIFRRVGENRARARGIEFLSDNGPEDTAQVFTACLEGLGRVPCRTPCRSPESNGVAEAFFGTLKRDSIYQGCLETVGDLERPLPGWISDDNEVAPHSALGMRSPARFYEEWVAKIKQTPVQT